MSPREMCQECLIHFVTFCLFLNLRRRYHLRSLALAAFSAAGGEFSTLTTGLFLVFFCFRQYCPSLVSEL